MAAMTLATLKSLLATTVFSSLLISVTHLLLDKECEGVWSSAGHLSKVITHRAGRGIMGWATAVVLIR